MISALCWVPRGAARERPTRFQPSQSEIHTAEQYEETEQQEQGLQNGCSDVEAALRELQMDQYDEEDDVGLLGDTGIDMEATAGDGVQEEDEEDDDASEAEDLQIKPTDLVIVTAKHEEVISSLEIWVYEDSDEGANVYVHHDMILGACPLCLAWMDINPNTGTDRANVIAVGTFDPNIELWDLDLVDAIEPIGDLKSHQDAVLSLSWNKEYRNVLASGSADNTVKVWDVSTYQCSQTLSHHSNKVQSVVWNNADCQILVTGGYDQQVFLVDVRQAQSQQNVKWKLNSDVESIIWDLQTPTNFLVSTEDGVVQMFDARKPGEAALLSFQAHEKAATTISLSSAVNGLIATGSIDKKIKLWDISSGQNAQLLAEEDLKVGAVFSGEFSRDEPWLLIAGGAKGEVSVWDIRSHQNIQNRYSVTFT